MKKMILTAAFMVVSFSALFAQASFKFGATGGLLNTDANFDLNVILTDLRLGSINETGFYIGGIADIGLSEKFHIQPEVTYGSAGDLSFIYVPIMAKVYVIQGLNIQFGPQLNFNSNVDEIKDLLDDIVNSDDENRFTDSLKSSAIDLGFGAGYDITNSFSVQARYAVPLTNRYNGPGDSLLDIKNSTLNIGVAYFF